VRVSAFLHRYIGGEEGSSLRSQVGIPSVTAHQKLRIVVAEGSPDGPRIRWLEGISGNVRFVSDGIVASFIIEGVGCYCRRRYTADRVMLQLRREVESRSWAAICIKHILRGSSRCSRDLLSALVDSMISVLHLLDISGPNR
jgi:hypothetical protein